MQIYGGAWSRQAVCVSVAVVLVYVLVVVVFSIPIYIYIENVRIWIRRLPSPHMVQNQWYIIGLVLCIERKRGKGCPWSDNRAEEDLGFFLFFKYERAYRIGDDR